MGVTTLTDGLALVWVGMTCIRINHGISLAVLVMLIVTD